MIKKTLFIILTLNFFACDPQKSNNEGGEANKSTDPIGTKSKQESKDSTGNFHPRQKGGSTPSDNKGNY